MKDRTIFRISLLIVLCAVLAAGYASGAVAETAENLYDYSQIEKWELYPEKFALLSTGAPDGSQAEPEARTINVDYGRTFTLAFADYARYQSDHFYILAGEDKFTEGLKLEGVLYDNGVAFSLSPEQLETVSSNNEKNVWLTVHAADEPCLLIELNRSPADACNTVGFAAILLCDGQGRLIGRPTDAFADDEENVYFMTSPAVGEVAFDLHGTQVPLNQDAANPSLQTLGASMLYGEELTFASPSTLPDMMNYGPDQPLASMTTRIWQKGYEYPRFNNFEEYDSTYGHDEPESTAGNTISLAASETDDLVFNCFDMAGVYTRVDVELGSLGNPDNEGNRLFNGYGAIDSGKIKSEQVKANPTTIQFEQSEMSEIDTDLAFKIKMYNEDNEQIPTVDHGWTVAYLVVSKDANKSNIINLYKSGSFFEGHPVGSVSAGSSMSFSSVTSSIDQEGSDSTSDESATAAPDQTATAAPTPTETTAPAQTATAAPDSTETTAPDPTETAASTDAPGASASPAPTRRSGSSSTPTPAPVPKPTPQPGSIVLEYAPDSERADQMYVRWTDDAEKNKLGEVLEFSAETPLQSGSDVYVYFYSVPKDKIFDVALQYTIDKEVNPHIMATPTPMPDFIETPHGGSDQDDLEDVLDSETYEMIPRENEGDPDWTLHFRSVEKAGYDVTVMIAPTPKPTPVPVEELDDVVITAVSDFDFSGEQPPLVNGSAIEALGGALTVSGTASASVTPDEPELISVRVSDGEGNVLLENAEEVAVGDDGAWTCELSFTTELDGVETLAVTADYARDETGDRQDRKTVSFDLVPPEMPKIEVLSRTDSAETLAPDQIRGSLDGNTLSVMPNADPVTLLFTTDADTAELKLSVSRGDGADPAEIGGDALERDENGAYIYPVPEGATQISATAVDAVGNVSERNDLIVRFYAPIAVNAAELSRREGNAYTLRASGAAEANAELSAVVRLAPRNGEATQWETALTAQNMGAWTLSEDVELSDPTVYDVELILSYVGFGGYTVSAGTQTVDLEPPAAPAVALDATGWDELYAPVTDEGNGQIWLVAGVDGALQVTAPEPDAKLYYNIAGSNPEGGDDKPVSGTEFDGRLAFSALRDNTLLTVWAADASGNESLRQRWAVNEIAKIAVEQAEQLVYQRYDDQGEEIPVGERTLLSRSAVTEMKLDPYRNLLVSGTAQPGWTVVAQLRGTGEHANDIAEPLGSVTVDQDGGWSVEIRYNQADRFGEACNLDLSYEKAADQSYRLYRPVTFENVTITTLEINTLTEGERQISGTGPEGARVKLSVADGENAVAGEGEADVRGNVFYFTLERPAAMGEKYTVQWSTDLGPQPPLSAETVPFTGDARLTLDIPAYDPAAGTLTLSGQRRADGDYDVALTVLDGEGNAVLTKEAPAAETADESQIGDIAPYEIVLDVADEGLADGTYDFRAEYKDWFMSATGRDAQISYAVDTTSAVAQIDAPPRENERSVTLTLSEPAYVTVMSAGDGAVLAEQWIDEAGQAEISFDSDLKGVSAVRVATRDAAGNTWTSDDVAVGQTALYYVTAMEPLFLTNGSVDASLKEVTLVGYVVGDRDQPDELDPERVKVSLTVTPDGDGADSREYSTDGSDANKLPPPAVERVTDAPTQQAKIDLAKDAIVTDQAKVWRVTQRVRMAAGMAGQWQINMDVESGGSAPDPVKQQAQAIRAEVPGGKFGTSAAVIAALVLALGVAVFLLIRMNKKLTRLKEANVDNDSRQSNLTIKKRG